MTTVGLCLQYTYRLFQTYIGDILVAVNPCKPLNLFDDKVSQPTTIAYMT